MGVKTRSLSQLLTENGLIVHKRLQASFCFFVIGLKWNMLVSPKTEVLFGVSLRWEKPDYPQIWLPQRADIIAWAVSNLYRLDLRKPCCYCSDVPWIGRCCLAFIWWCNFILGSFKISDSRNVIIRPVIIWNNFHVLQSLSAVIGYVKYWRYN